MSKAIYAFSGDPITYGHIDIILRAADVFDELVVAIGVNPDKQYLFSLE
jgi:pantetheine-phosphate adenylyltransferase